MARVFQNTSNGRKIEYLDPSNLDYVMVVQWVRLDPKGLPVNHWMVLAFDMGNEIAVWSASDHRHLNSLLA